MEIDKQEVEELQLGISVGMGGDRQQWISAGGVRGGGGGGRSNALPRLLFLPCHLADQWS